MKIDRARTSTWSAISLLVPALAACADDPSTTTTTDSGSSSSGSTSSSASEVPTTGDGPTTTGLDPTTSTRTSTSTTSDSTTGGVSATSTGTGDPTTGGEPCMKILCGDPAACCVAGEECVDGECVDSCPGGVRCGADQELCCADGELCAGAACAAPGGPCKDAADCEPGDFCEPQLGKCLEQLGPLLCAQPKSAEVEVTLEWSFTKDEVIAMPVVADVTGDGTPEVIVNTARVTGVEGDFSPGEILCLDGETGAELWRIKHDPVNKKFGAQGRATIAVGDVSGDGEPDIVYAGLQEGPTKVSPIHAVDGDGVLLWTSHLADDTVAKIRVEQGTATLVNLDADPQAEIAFGAAILDHDGLLVWNQSNIGGMVGTPHAKGQPANYIYPGGMATFADLDKDSYPELITGREAWKISWSAGNPPTVSLAQKWKDTSGVAGDGWPAIADLDANGTPEVVLTAWPELKILDGATGKLWCGIDPSGALCEGNDAMRTQPILIVGGNLGGPATIADLDGDGRPEFGITTGADYRVFDLNRPGETIVKPMNDPAPAPGAIFTRWASKVQDKSSAATGSSVFDFQGDGQLEIIYQDECFARVYDGATGTIRLALMNSSATIHEYPLVADLDGDGEAELLVVANQSVAIARAGCVATTPNWVPNQGLFSYGAGDDIDAWVATRELWTQHTYHVTNAGPDGNVPMMEQDNWTSPGLNNFRQNLQSAGSPNAPDLSVSLAVGLDQCGADELVLQATIYNEGALGVPAGIDVTFYEGVDATGLVLGTMPTTDAILPGASTTLDLTVDGPPAGMTASYFVEVDGGIDDMIQECQEANNGALVTEVACPG